MDTLYPWDGYHGYFCFGAGLVAERPTMSNHSEGVMGYSISSTCGQV